MIPDIPKNLATKNYEIFIFILVLFHINKFVSFVSHSHQTAKKII